MKHQQSFGVHFTIKRGREKDAKTNVYTCITKAQVCLGQFMQSGKVSLPDQLGKNNLFIGSHHIDLTDIVQVLVQRLAIAVSY